MVFWGRREEEEERGVKREERRREGVTEGEERREEEARVEEGIAREERGANRPGRRAIKFKLILVFLTCVEERETDNKKFEEIPQEFGKRKAQFERENSTRIILRFSKYKRYVFLIVFIFEMSHIFYIMNYRFKLFCESQFSKESVIFHLCRFTQERVTFFEWRKEVFLEKNSSKLFFSKSLRERRKVLSFLRSQTNTKELISFFLFINVMTNDYKKKNKIPPPY